MYHQVEGMTFFHVRYTQTAMHCLNKCYLSTVPDCLISHACVPDANMLVVCRVFREIGLFPPSQCD